MMYRLPIVIVACTLFFPAVSDAGILINEVAWMGTTEPTTGSYCEWIELWNTDAETIDVSGWTLSFGSAAILLGTGTSISGDGFFVIERQTPTACPDPVPQSNDLTVSFGSGLPNTGATLTLSNAEGTEVDVVDGSNEWKIGGDTVKGNNETKETAQRAVSGWVTGAPTPGAENISYDTPEETETVATNTTQSNSTKKSGGSSSKKTAPKPKAPEVPNVLSLSIDAPKIAYVNQEVSFEAIPQGVGKTIMNSLSYTWNFGDTYTASSKKASHIFRYPGEYIVVVEGAFGKHREMVRHEVKVLPVSFTLSKTPKGDIEVKNNASYEVDLGGFSLLGQTRFMFPKNTFIKPKGVLTVPVGRVGNASALSLYDAQSAAVVTHSSDVVTPRTIASASLRQERTNAQSGETEKETAAAPSSTVIRIGAEERAETENLITRLFSRLSRIFGP